MSTWSGEVVMLGVLLSVGVLLSPQATVVRAPAPPAATQLADQLEDRDIARRIAAANEIAARKDLVTDVALRSKVLAVLNEVTGERIRAMRSESWGRAPGPDEDKGIFMLALVRAASVFSGTAVRDALVVHVGHSTIAMNRVAEEGSRSIANMLALYDRPDGPSESDLIRFGALRTLATIIRKGSASTDDRERLLTLATGAMKSKSGPVVAGAIYLGVALGSPEIISTAAAIRSGRNAPMDLPSPAQRLIRDAAERALSMAGVK